ncbi:hypothetical protein ABT096_29325 [Streptomyces sp. NPDC002561]|uniref:hypothetical protein n=1 Tax=Streptomyces sp. NPDC002561 TaxID=3154418 RepID=UPI0033308563
MSTQPKSNGAGLVRQALRAGHARAIRFDPEPGRMGTGPDAPACATKLRWTAPRLVAAANDEVPDANARAVHVLPPSTAATKTSSAGAAGTGQGQALPELGGVEDLSDKDLADMRATGWGEFMAGDTTLVMSTVDALGPAATEYDFGAELLQRAHRLTVSSSLMTIGHR